MKVTLSKPENFVPAIIAEIFHCGHVASAWNDSALATVVYALETPASTFYLRDSDGTLRHRFAQAVSGFTLSAERAEEIELLGEPILAHISVNESCAVLHSVRSFPKPPRYEAPAFSIYTSDPQLGARGGSSKRVGGMIEPRRAAKYPTPPVPKTPPREWSIEELLTARASEIPGAVHDLVRRSVEWQSQSEPKAKSR